MDDTDLPLFYFAGGRFEISKATSQSHDKVRFIEPYVIGCAVILHHFQEVFRSFLQRLSFFTTLKVHFFVSLLDFLLSHAPWIER